MIATDFIFGKKKVGSSEPLLLDSLPTATFAYSLCRKLNSSYNGPIFRVAGMTGSEDISFTSEGMVDEVQLQSFVNAQSDGYAIITIVYDQSGNGRDIGQGVGGNNKGNFEIARTSNLHRAANGKIARLYGAMLRDEQPFSSGSLSLFSVVQHNGTGLLNSMIDCTDNQQFESSNGFRFDKINSTLRFGVNGSFITNSDTAAGQVEVKTAINNDSGRSIYKNDVLVNSDSAVLTPNYSGVTQYKLLSTTNGTDQYSFADGLTLAGYFQEAIAYDLDASNFRTTIDQNLIDFYL